MELDLDGEATVLGGIADSVHEVIELEPGNIDPPPRIAVRWRTDFIQGMGKRGDDFIIVLDVSQTLSSLGHNAGKLERCFTGFREIVFSFRVMISISSSPISTCPIWMELS